MTPTDKRLHAACAAMQGLAAGLDRSINDASWDRHLVEDAVNVADALLAELERTAPEQTCRHTNRLAYSREGMRASYENHFPDVPVYIQICGDCGVPL